MHAMQALEDVYVRGRGADSKVTPTMIAFHWTQSCRSQERRGLDMADMTRIIHVRPSDSLRAACCC